MQPRLVSLSHVSLYICVSDALFSVPNIPNQCIVLNIYVLCSRVSSDGSDLWQVVHRNVIGAIHPTLRTLSKWKMFGDGRWIEMIHTFWKQSKRYTAIHIHINKCLKHYHCFRTMMISTMVCISMRNLFEEIGTSLNRHQLKWPRKKKQIFRLLFGVSCNWILGHNVFKPPKQME